MRGTPFLMEGEELGFVNVSWPSIDDYNDVSTKNHYQYAIDEGYSEEEAMAGVHRFARDSARTPMQWDSSSQAGFTAGTPWLPVYEDYAVYNVASETEDPDSVLNWYIALANLRQEHTELMTGDYEEIFHDNEQIFAYIRESEAGKAIILINLSTAAASYDPACVENAELILGTNDKNEKGSLAPLEAVIYEETKN